MVYEKGTTPASELDAMRRAWARCGAAMQAAAAWDILEGWKTATEAEQLGKQVTSEAGRFRAFYAAFLVDERRVSQKDLARMLNMSPGRVSQLVKAGRQQEGNPVTDPGNLPEQPVLALAIITSEKGVLVVHRRDKTPPWSFPGGELQPGETAANALIRRVREEVGIDAKPVHLFGRRVHPLTNRWMVYQACEVEGAPVPQVLDTEDLDDARWIGVNDAEELMPDMYPPVLEHLKAVLGTLGVYRTD